MQFVPFLWLIIPSKLTDVVVYIQRHIYNPITARRIINPLFREILLPAIWENGISSCSFYPIKNTRRVGVSTLTSREYPNSAEKRNGKGRKYTISRRARSFPAVASRTRGYSRQSRYEELSPPSRPLGDEISAPVSPCCHSRVQIFRLVRRISIYLSYLRYVCPPSDVETTLAIRPVEHNSVGTLFLFSSSPSPTPLNFFTVSNTRAVDQRIRCCSLAEPFLCL